MKSRRNCGINHVVADNRVERMGGAFVADFRHNTAHHFLLSELRRVKGAAIAFDHRPCFLNHVHRLALAERNKFLQGIEDHELPSGGVFPYLRV